MTIFEGVALAGIAIAIALVAARIAARRQAGERRRIRLERAFNRARRVQGAGTGEQGRPYSLYGKRSWQDDA